MKHFIFCFLICTLGFAQNDTLKLRNNDVIVGEIKKYTEGVLQIKTSYSDKDFLVEFDKITELKVERNCVIILSGGARRFGKVSTIGPGEVSILLENGEIEYYPLYDILALMEVNDNFWKRFEAAIDLGFNLTKANNSNQFSISGRIDYTGNRLLMSGRISTLNKKQDNANDTKRTDANVDITRLFKGNLFLLGDISFLSNTAQALTSRISPSLSFGKLVKSTSKLNLGVSAGYSYNIEKYLGENTDRISSELLIATRFNIFNMKDFDLKTSLNISPSLSQKDRIRLDYDIYLKYDLFWDFYVKGEFTLNYDNKPVIEGAEVDYIFTTGFGWKFD
jgi:hypothetical protein